MKKKQTFEDINTSIFNNDGSVNGDLGIAVSNEELVEHVRNVCSKTKDEKCKKCPFKPYTDTIKELYEL